MQGTRIGQYELQRVLGRGAFGEVWLAKDHHLERLVAIKRLKPEVLGDSDARRRFDLEAKTLLQINEPHVVRVLDRIEIEGAPALVTEYMDGGSLSDMMKARKEPFPIDDIVRWCEQAALGLAAIHRRGILHRDIKPANLFLSEDGNLSIGDFGLARSVDKTQTLGLQGTMPYMSPEQIRGVELDARSDLFSLGVAIFELLTGTRPFGDGLDRVQRSDTADSLRPGVPVEISDTIEALLEPDVEKRVQSADELLARLHGEGPGNYIRMPSRRRFAVVTTALLAIAAVVFFGRPLISPPPPHTCDLDPPDGRRIALLNFEYRGSEEFERLATEIPTLLASRLDGVSGIEAASPDIYETCSISPQLLTHDEPGVKEWMEEHHVRVAVSGVITELSGRVRIDLTSLYHKDEDDHWHDESSFTLDDAGDALLAVNDLGLGILRQILRDPADDLSREVLAAGTSLEALSAFIGSHVAFRRGYLTYPEYSKPAALDSTMAMAYYVESMVAAMFHQGDARIGEYLAKASRHKDRLGPYGRLLIESAEHELNREMDRAEATLTEAVSAYPDNPWALLRLANLHFQHNSARGHSFTGSRREFDLVQQMDPLNFIPSVFSQWLAAAEGDDEALATYVGWAPPEHQQTIFAFTSGTQAERDSLLSHVNYCETTLNYANLITLCYPDIQFNLIQLLEAQYCDETPPENRAWTSLSLAHINAGIGRWEKAREWFAETPAPFWSIRREYEALAMSLPFVAAGDDQIRAMIQELQRWRPLDEPSRVDPQQFALVRQRFDSHIPVHEHLRLYCLSALHTRIGDVISARLALDQLASTPVEESDRDFIEDLLVMGEARIAYAAEEYQTALDHLQQVRQFKYLGGNYSAFFQRSDARYLRARCLVELGRYQEALGWFDASDEGVEFLLIYSAFGNLGQANALENLGQPEDASEHYRKFIDSMGGCDPEYEPTVDAARERLAVLEGAG